MPRDEDYEVLYDWEPENEDDLRLIAGETISVLEKNDHGWWYGIAARKDTLHKGFFPRNYVKKKVPLNPGAPRPPPRPSQKVAGGGGGTGSRSSGKEGGRRGSGSSKSGAAGSGTADHTPSKKVKEASKTVKRISLHAGPSFSLKSLAAFDELKQFGYTVEVNAILRPNSKSLSKQSIGNQPSAVSGAVEDGMTVRVQCNAMIWDGALIQTKEFANGLVTFIAGAGQVTAGLDAAVKRLRIGEKATVTCAPIMAYGAAGNPPAVPSNTHVIFHIEVISATFSSATETPSGKTAASISSPSTDEAVEETRKLLGNAVAVRQPTAGQNQGGKRGSHRLMLVDATGGSVDQQQEGKVIDPGTHDSQGVNSVDDYYKGETSSISLNDDIQDP